MGCRYVSPSPTPIGDLLDGVVSGDRHRSTVPREPGGEWDAWRSLPARQRRRLIGGGYARPGGLRPDVLATVIAAAGVDDPLEWYFRTALRALDERRSAANRDRHRAVAAQHGHRTYYEHRSAFVRELGYRSVYDYRRERGWI